MDQEVSPSRPRPFWAALLRLSLGWIFIWAFLDKLVGLGFATPANQGWLDGVSPTLGFLKFGSVGPLKGFYGAIAGTSAVDWLYMLGLATLGLALLKGIALKIAGWSGALMMVLFWSAALPPEHNPFLDEHVIYVIILLAIARRTDFFSRLSLQRWWHSLSFVRQHRWLE